MSAAGFTPIYLVRSVLSFSAPSVTKEQSYIILVTTNVRMVKNPKIVTTLDTRHRMKTKQHYISNTGTCVFPYSLRKQSWLYKIAAEPYIQSTVEFTQSTIIFKKENIPNKHVFSSNIIHCQNEIGFRRFVTKEIDVNDTSSRYRCIKIINIGHKTQNENKTTLHFKLKR
jgi:hypothetical protein